MKSILNMALAVIVCALAAHASAKGAKYNILSLDAAKYAGIMTADFVGYMEKRAYSIAREDGRGFCYPENDEERIPMHELFDMVAGSETGAIIAATIAQPKEAGSAESKYFAGRAA